MTIKVTRDEIMDGLKCDGRNCPIALALHRGGVKFINVSRDSVSLWGLYGMTESALPYRAKDFIRQFDAASHADRLLFDEFEFELEVPETTIPESLNC